MSIWIQLNLLIRRFFPNLTSQLFLYLGLAIIFIANPTRQRLVYFGIETFPGYYFYLVAAILILIAIVAARVLPKRRFSSISAAVTYWVDRKGGLDYAAYHNEMTGLENPDLHSEPAAERLHYDQLKQRAEKLVLKIVDEQTMIEDWRRFASLIHSCVKEMDSKRFSSSLLGKNEKITFDTVMGAVYYWRLSDREVLIGVTTDQHSVDNLTANSEFTSLGESILELTTRRRNG